MEQPYGEQVRRSELYDCNDCCAGALRDCALYCGVSTKDKGQDYENQLIQFREFAFRMSWTIVFEFCDTLSAGISDREQLEMMFEAASRRQFDVLLFWSLDRLSREGVLPTLRHLGRLTSYSVGYRSYTEKYFDSCGIFKDAVIAIVATVDKQEKVRIRERTLAGLERARRQEKTLGRPKVEANAELIRSLSAQGLSWTVIAHQTGCTRSTCQRLSGA